MSAAAKKPVGSSRIPTFGSRLPQPSSSATAINTNRITISASAAVSSAISARSSTQPIVPSIHRSTNVGTTVGTTVASRPRSPQLPQPPSRQGSAASLKGAPSKPSSHPPSRPPSRTSSRPPSRPASPSTQAIRPGQSAHVGGKRGTIRYVGDVHWAPGVWCGLEVSVGAGKHDGSVHGRRYFQCAPSAGVMAPLAKVQVLHVDQDAGQHQNQRERSDDVSGPYSMLFIDSQVEGKNTNTTSSQPNETFIKNLEQPGRRQPSEIITNRQEISNKKRCNDTFIASCSRIQQADHEDKPFQNCENSLSDSNIEVKRRRTGNSKNQRIESLTLRSLPESIEKPTSLFQPKSCSTPPLASLVFKKLSYTSVKNEIAEPLLRKLRNSFMGNSDKNHEEDSKTDSLDDSLGILTPDQMSDFPSFAQTRSPSFEYENSDCFLKKQDESCCEEKLPCPKTLSLSIPHSNTSRSKEDLQSPNAGATDYSFGIIDDQVLSNLTLITDTTVNLDELNLGRMEQTPSPEDLPLDPAPIVEADKVDATKVKTTNNFVTSITSITSLDTGYQGDGEMSRPASRGADSSPLTRRPLPRPQTRRQDPMTDSDFYTESDADNHDDNQLKGDRKAQVIDGTLYGVDPQAAADIYVNNRENMDSSGIFTDIENPRTEEDTVGDAIPDPSPSDTSTKTISVINSQNNLQDILDKKNESKEIIEKQVPKDNPKKRNAPSPRLFTASPVRSKEESIVKKYKMPKREVTSKVKTMIKSPQLQTPDTERKKPVGRWDAVMSKITKTDPSKTNLKEVKSKVYNNVRPAITQKSPNNKLFSPNRHNIIRNNSSAQTPIKTSPGVKRPKSALSSASPIERRVRNRSSTGSVSKIANLENSINSSLSDLSAATLPPNNKTIGASKKRDVVQVTQVLTANKLSPRTQAHTAAENKKNATLHPSPSTADKTRRKEKKQIVTKECSRGTAKGGRTSPTAVRPPQQQLQQPQPQQRQQNQQSATGVSVVSKLNQTLPTPPIAEALAVLVQHLVFNVEAYQVPSLRRQVQKYRLEAEEVRLACQQLEETLAQERVQQVEIIEQERVRCRKDIAEVIEKHRQQIQELDAKRAELERHATSEKDKLVQTVTKQHEDQLLTLKLECEKLQRTHEEALDILREENDSIREQIDQRRMEAEQERQECKKIREEYENREAMFKEKNHKLKQQMNKLQNDYEEKLKSLTEDNKRLRDENARLLGCGDDDKGIGSQEVQSLKVVLELKQNELTELRRALAEASHKCEVLIGAEEKARTLNARCEDLQLQLQRKSEYVQSIIQDNKKLQEILGEEQNQKKRLSQYNEELQWRLKQTKEVMTEVVQQAGDTSFNRSILHSSFNERHAVTKPNLERRLSFKERASSVLSNTSVEESYLSCNSMTTSDFDIADDSTLLPSPQVKVMVKKSDSVSYVLDLEESPAVVASRIIRRSFRNSTPPKNTPTKSPSNKRPRIRNPLSQSASSSAIIGRDNNDLNRPHSADARNGDMRTEEDDVFIWTRTPATPTSYSKTDDSPTHANMKLGHLDLDEDNIDDMQLPALPSELGNGAQALPTPKHLAGEAMVSESNSEDESTSSSQL